MNKIIGYCIAQGTLHELPDAVATLLQEGWQPYGPPFTVPDETQVYQAMVKYEREPHAGLQEARSLVKGLMDRLDGGNYEENGDLPFVNRAKEFLKKTKP